MSETSISSLISQFGPNSGFIKDLYEQYLLDPTLVPNEWAKFFANGGLALIGGAEAPTPPVAAVKQNAASEPARLPSSRAAALPTDAELISQIARLVEAYRNRGHLKAKINPLSKGIVPLPEAVDLAPEHHGISAEELESEVPTCGVLEAKQASVQQIISTLEKTYCNSVGFQFNHLTNIDEREWLRERIELQGKPSLSAEEHNHALTALIEAEVFESQLAKRYVGKKWFSLQGGESLIPMLDRLVERSAQSGSKEVIIGMAHRGRLNVLVNILGKPLAEIFSEFDEEGLASVIGSGDVKYHLGRTYLRETKQGPISIELAPNPSHLEFINPVILGMARARQDKLYSANRGSVLPVALHGDSAFIGQGVVFETLNLSRLEGYGAGGTVHLVINNQVGFTTTPDEYRSTTYCTDMALGMEIPVFHVNSEDVEACLWVTDLALEFRNKFGRDVIIDLYCYRKYGHNEADDPSFTQPQMYAEIAQKKPLSTIYSESIRTSGVLSKDQIKDLIAAAKTRFEEAETSRTKRVIGEACATYGRLRVPTPPTGIPVEELERIAKTIITYPDNFKPHPKLQKIIEKRTLSVTSGELIEWGVAEALAFGSLLTDGVSIRLSGQDVRRGTFSHRHLVLDNYEKPGAYTPLTPLIEGRQGVSIEAHNSSLSESGVVGFEYGYASTAPRSLVIWEAQFGDFGNGAQVFIDQFLSSSEVKWDLLTGLTLLLPHGYEGAGPEHSSARLERYLQLCAEGNMMVCYPSNAAQYFHLIRRQGIMEIKRPLIVMTPKSLLRNPAASCHTQDLTQGHFETVIEEDLQSGEEIDTVVMLSGKVYYDVIDALKKAGRKKVKVIRFEQLYPFPQFEVKKALKNIIAQNYVWVQEEPQNMGAWSYIDPYIRHKLGVEATYVGRPVSASTACGTMKRSAMEQKQYLDELLEIAKR